MPPIITPVTPGPAQPTLGASSPQAEARARAIAMLANSQPGAQAAPPVDQTNVSIENLSAVSGTSQENGQSDIVDETIKDPSEEVTTPKEEEAPLSTQHAILARKEKAFRAKVVAQEQSFKSKEAALAAREVELSTKYTQDLSNYIPKDKLKTNALDILNGLGVTYDNLSEQALTASSPEAQYMRQMRAELEEQLQKVREEQAKTNKTFETQQAQAYEQAVNQIRREADQLVNADPSFETIKETGSVSDVVELIERTFKEEGTLLTVEQAATAVEEHLIEEAMKISKLKKIQDRLKSAQPAVAKQPAQPAPKQQSAQPQMKTLTNSVSNSRPLSSRERAILAMKGELK